MKKKIMIWFKNNWKHILSLGLTWLLNLLKDKGDN